MHHARSSTPSALFDRSQNTTYPGRYPSARVCTAPTGTGGGGRAEAAVTSPTSPRIVHHALEGFATRARAATAAVRQILDQGLWSDDLQFRVWCSGVGGRAFGDMSLHSERQLIAALPISGSASPSTTLPSAALPCSSSSSLSPPSHVYDCLPSVYPVHSTTYLSILLLLFA